MKRYLAYICDYNKLEYLDIRNDVRFGKYDFYYQDDLLYLKCLNGLTFKDGSTLKKIEAGYYETVLNETFYTVSLYIYDYQDTQFKKYCLKDVLISDYTKASLKTYDKFLKGSYTFIKNKRIISNFKYIYLNKNRYNGEMLRNNDLIEILGLKIIYNDKLLIINNFMCQNNLNELDLSKVIFDNFSDEIIDIKHYYQAKLKCPNMKYSIDLKDYIHQETSSFVINLIQSFFVSLGMLTIAIINVYIGIQNNRSTIELLPIIMMPIIMAISSLLFPVINRYFQKHKQFQKEKNIQEYNLNCILNLENHIRKDIEDKRIFHNSFVFDKNKVTKLFKDASFYSRTRDDFDYLCIYLGYGTIKNKVDIKVLNGANYLYNQDLIKKLKFKYSTTNNIPIFFDLRNYSYILFKISKNDLYNYFQNILLQLVMLHNDLKLALYIDEDDYCNIRYLKDLYIFTHNNNRMIYFSESEIPFSEDEILLLTFKSLKSNFDKGKYKIIHFSDNDIIPKDAKAIVFLNKGKGSIQIESESQEFRIYDYEFNYEELFYRLRNYRLDNNIYKKCNYELIDYYNRNLNLFERYKQKHKGIEVMIGVRDDGRPLIYDISDKGIGPHLVISGGTGSGKSVHVLSFILSLTTNYPASKLNIALIDYKGSGLIESLSYKGKPLPHITTYLTNLDKDIFDRAIIALNKECERREKTFRELSNLTRTSIMCLEDYHSVYFKESGLAYLPYQFIIIDEFAEMKKEKPDFVKDIISIARIGRSLGIELVLITQKPSPAVDQEIWSNITYRIALKAQNESDSKEMLGNDLAYKIKAPGEFYLMHNNMCDHGYTLNSRAFIDKRNDAYVAIVNHDLSNQKVAYFKTNNNLRQLETYIKQICDYHDENNIKPESIYLDTLNTESNISLLKKYNYSLKEKEIILGEYDDFLELNIGLLIHDIKLNPFVTFVYKDVSNRNLVISNIIESCVSTNYEQKIIYIHDNKNEMKYIKSGVEYIYYMRCDDILYVIDRIIKENLDVYVIIDDYESIIQYEIVKDKLENLFMIMFQKKLKLFIFVRNYSFMPFKYRDNFFKYHLNVSNKEDVLMLFNKYNKYSEESIFDNGERIVGFKIALANMVLVERSVDSIVRNIPDKIVFKHTKERIMVGYNLFTRNIIMINRKSRIYVISYYKELLEHYKEILNIKDDNLVFVEYKNVKDGFLYDLIVWIGPNINNQYLFIPKIKHDLKINEGYLYINGKEGVKFIYE